MSIYNFGSNSAYSPYPGTSGYGTSAYSPYTGIPGYGTSAYSPYTATSALGAYSPYTTSALGSSYSATSGSGSSFSGANLANLFQESYRNALQGNNALGISTSSLVNEALGGAMVAGSNPLNPLQGQPALEGLDSFVTGLQTSYAARQAAGSTSSGTGTGASGAGTGGMSTSDMLSAISSMLGMLGGGSSSGLGGSSLLNGYSPSSSSAFDISGQNALNSGSPYSSSAYDVSADQTGGGSSSSNLLGELQSMLAMLTSMMSSMGGSSSGAGVPTYPGASKAYSPYGGSGSSPLNSPSLFTQGVNMNLIDSAINQTLGSISNTLPMVNL